MRVGGLFSGLAGIESGLKLTGGFEIAWLCEIDPYCRRVLRKLYPEVPIYDDVRALRAESLPAVDILTGGFPCTEISSAGDRAGLEGKRSGLWAEMARLIRDLQPRYALVENVPALLVRGMGRVLGDLAEGGYDAEWDCLPAAAFGAPHLRARIWLLAYPSGSRHGAQTDTVFAGRHGPKFCAWWASEPRVARVSDGLPNGLERRRALGNAVVPQVAEWIGRRILEWEVTEGRGVR